MHTQSVTTPFGRRGITIALVKGQLDLADIKAGKTVDKWRVFRDACEAREKLGIQDRSLAVLSALLSFYPDNELSGERGLVVFPSNAQLSIRAHGIAGSTLRRHLIALVDAGLITRKDSANGKRYAHKDRAGDIQDAYGFSLAPLLARSEELALMAQKVAEERKLFKVMKERLTICRRNVRKLISAAIEENVPGNWEPIESHYTKLVGSIPRAPTADDLKRLIMEMSALETEIVNLLKIQTISKNTGTDAIENGQHIQDSQTESISESEPATTKRQGENIQLVSNATTTSIVKRTYPLALVLQACPDIQNYGPGGSISGWRELMSAAIVVRSMLGVSASAYQEACEILGPENAATVMACILERAESINCAGGYLRDLTVKTQRGEFSMGPMLMALLRANGPGSANTG